MFKLDSSLQKPLYKQVVDETKKLITKGMLKENDKMPSIREFAKILNVNISTVQKAYQELEKEKIIVTIVGRGTFITENLDAIKPNYELIDTLLEELVREAKICGITKEELIKMEKVSEKKLETILEKILLEWRFIGLSKEKLEEKVISRYKEVESYEIRNKKSE